MIFRAFMNRLYARIWLAVVLSIASLSLLSTWIMKIYREPPLKEVVVRSDQGVILGQGLVRLHKPQETYSDGTKVPDTPLQLSNPQHPPQQDVFAKRVTPELQSPGDVPYEEINQSLPQGQFGPGPEFIVQLSDGQLLHIHLPSPPLKSSFLPRFGFVWSMVIVAIAVALATYPIIRRLTRRLESLRTGVERWGTGELSTRLDTQGEDEIGFLAQRFNHAASQIEALVVAHKTLLANASHELRTPLTRIRMSMELMNAHQNPQMIDEVKKSISELDQLIDEILLASRLDAKNVDVGRFEDVDLTGLASEECSRAKVNLELGPEPQSIELICIPRLIRRLLRNLIDNAIRHSGQLEGVEVQLDVLSQEGAVKISVCDRGPGVPEDQRDQIFKPFFRLQGKDEHDKGVGLGLALVQSIAQRHNGWVRHLPRPGGGSIFEVSLPRPKGLEQPAHFNS
jgi:signal transduction histidine kinase